MSELERLSASERETEDPLISPAPAHDQTVPPPMAGGARAQRGLPKHKSPRRAQLEGNSEPPSISLSDYEKMVYGTEDVSHRRAVAFSSDLRIKSHELFKELDEISALDEKIKLKERDRDRLFKESLVLVENVETINKQIKKRLQSTKNLNHNKGMIQPGDQICTEYENRSKQDGELSHPPENIESKEDIKLKAFIHRRRKRITGIIEKAKDKLRRYDKITDEIKHLKIKQSELKSKSQKTNTDLERIANMIVKLNSHQDSFRKGKPLTPLDELTRLASSWEDIKDKASETIGPSIADATECMVKGDFCEKTSASAEFGKLVGSLLPPADVRDIVANTIGILETKPGATLGLVASFVGLFPGVGDAAKTAMKRYSDDALEVGARAVSNATETVARGAGNVAENTTDVLRKQSDNVTDIGANKIDDVADAGKSTKADPKPNTKKSDKQTKQSPDKVKALKTARKEAEKGWEKTLSSAFKIQNSVVKASDVQVVTKRLNTKIKLTKGVEIIEWKADHDGTPSRWYVTSEVTMKDGAKAKASKGKGWVGFSGPEETGTPYYANTKQKQEKKHKDIKSSLKEDAQIEANEFILNNEDTLSLKQVRKHMESFLSDQTKIKSKSLLHGLSLKINTKESKYTKKNGELIYNASISPNALNFKIIIETYQDGIVIHGGTLGDAGDLKFVAKRLVVPSDEFFLFCHGNDNGLDFAVKKSRLKGPSGWGNLDYQVAKDIFEGHRSHNKPASKIRLICCSSGKLPNGLAQKVANDFGVETIAPSTKIKVPFRPKITIDDITLLDGGNWITFKPSS